MLMPCAVLIVLVLASIAVDLTAVRLGQRDLQAAATDAANDAVTGGLHEPLFRAGFGYRIDAAAARATVMRTLQAKGLLPVLASTPQITIGLDGSVTVRLSQRVPRVVSRSLPGARSGTLVWATATATVQQR